MNGGLLVPILSGLGGILLGWIIRIVWEHRKIRLEHRLQIMHEMTTAFHKLSSQHYIRFGQAATDLKMGIERFEADAASFYRLAKLLRIYERIPSIQLRCGLAESVFTSIAGELWDLIYQVAEFTEGDFNLLQEGNIDEKFADFIQILETESWLTNIFEKFKVLVDKSKAEVMDLLQCHSDIIYMEVTCGKEPWYTREEICQQAKEGLDQLKDLKHLSEKLKGEMSNYYGQMIKEYGLTRFRSIIIHKFSRALKYL